MNDVQLTNVIRCLAAETVQKANSGHPGAPMGMAPIAHTLWSNFLKYDPKDPEWHNRDRFVLSNGHASALLYTMLHLTGYNLPLEQLKQFRQLHSKTPGHPERHVTPGVEVTTGPLGQGISNAVGLAIAESHLAATFNRPGFPIVDHFTYVFCGDGCLMEGVTQETISLAGHLGLEKLVVVYDDNKITIDGNTELAFTENTEAKMHALGWHVIRVENGDSDFARMREALDEARHVRGKPKMIMLRTTIGYGSKLQGTEKVHGSPLGDAEIKRVKEAVFHRDPSKTFFVEPEAYEHYNKNGLAGAKRNAEWKALFAKYEAAHPQLAAMYKKYYSHQTVDPNIFAKLPKNDGKALASRKSSENAMAVLFNEIPNLVGGSADLTHSNLTRPGSVKLVDYQRNSPHGRIIRFGVREHGMAAIMNGIDAHGGLIAFGATFLNFIGYALGAVRLAAMSEHGVIFVATHDSIGVGEDGPTHQPVELVAGLRAMPHLQVMRPADQTETSAAWAVAVKSRKAPTVLCLSRHNLPSIEGTSLEGVMKGGYTVSSDANPTVVLIGTGSELGIAVDAAKQLRAKGIAVRVVSMVCTALFDAQPLSYRRSVLPAGAVVVSVEAYVALGWERYSHVHVGMPGFGASAPDKALYKHFNINPETVVAKALALLEHSKKEPITSRLSLSHL